MNGKDTLRGLDGWMVASLSSLFDGLANWFYRLAIRMSEEQKRSEIEQLLQLEDWQLQDMGITRDDVISALMQPAEVSSSARLTHARQRRLQR